jgi:hypothetical protein
LIPFCYFVYIHTREYQRQKRMLIKLIASKNNTIPTSVLNEYLSLAKAKKLNLWWKWKVMPWWIYYNFGFILFYFLIASKIFFFHFSNSIWYSYMCKKDQRFQQVALKHVCITLKLVQIGGVGTFSLLRKELIVFWFINELRSISQNSQLWGPACWTSDEGVWPNTIDIRSWVGSYKLKNQTLPPCSWRLSNTT